MKQQINEVRRMQQLAGIISENIGTKSPMKQDIVLPTGKFSNEGVITGVDDNSVEVTYLSQRTTQVIPIEKFLEEYRWENDIERWVKNEYDTPEIVDLENN